MSLINGFLWLAVSWSIVAKIDHETEEHVDTCGYVYTCLHPIEWLRYGRQFYLRDCWRSLVYWHLFETAQLLTAIGLLLGWVSSIHTERPLWQQTWLYCNAYTMRHGITGTSDNGRFYIRLGRAAD